MPQLFRNNARALLTGSITASDTTITVEASKADSFPVCNTGTGSVPASTDWCKLTLQDTSGNIEIVYARSRTLGSGVFSNVIRGQEGTTARAFASGSVCGLRLTSADLGPLGPLNNATTATQIRDAIDSPKRDGTGATGTWNINIAGSVSGNVTGNLTGNVTGDLTGNSNGVHSGSLASSVTATTQSSGDSTTKVATTAFVATALGFAVPAGTVITTAMSTAPSGYLKCNGAAVSRATYPALFSAIGVTYGAGDGVTTFNVPDLRGEFVRGLDDGRGVDSGRGIGTSQADELKSHSHTYLKFEPYTQTDSLSTPYGGRTFGAANNSTVATGGSETRPRNVALLYCIKT